MSFMSSRAKFSRVSLYAYLIYINSTIHVYEREERRKIEGERNGGTERGERVIERV